MKKDTDLVIIRSMVRGIMQGKCSESAVCKLAELPSVFVSEEDFSRALERLLNFRIRKINA